MKIEVQYYHTRRIKKTPANVITQQLDVEGENYSEIMRDLMIHYRDSGMCLISIRRVGKPSGS